ncbi:hypothetical protein [Primorskyibacter sp. S87]|uniref:hypothetical protein n=1 Tax=Primorskyibacter sp. S87 TaxID=3415126 RepID=UPI003C7DBDCA
MDHAKIHRLLSRQAGKGLAGGNAWEDTDHARDMFESYETPVGSGVAGFGSGYVDG